jgi:hypothetical protein
LNERRRVRFVSTAAGSLAVVCLLGAALVGHGALGVTHRATSTEAACAAVLMFLYESAGIVAIVTTIVDNHVAYPRSARMWLVIPPGIAALACMAAVLATAVAAADYRRLIENNWKGDARLRWYIAGSLIFVLLFAVAQRALAQRYDDLLYGAEMKARALARPVRADSLAERVARAQASLTRAGDSVRATLDATTESLREALASTTGIVDALEEELRVRRSALDELTVQAQSAQARAEEARELARVEESTAHALDALLDRRLTERLGELETAGHRWDTKLTLWSQPVNLLIGIVAGFMVAVLLGR